MRKMARPESSPSSNFAPGLDETGATNSFSLLSSTGGRSTDDVGGGGGAAALALADAAGGGVSGAADAEGGGGGAAVTSGFTGGGVLSPPHPTATAMRSAGSANVTRLNELLRFCKCMSST